MKTERGQRSHRPRLRPLRPPSPRNTTEVSHSLQIDTSADVDLSSALKYDVPDRGQDFHIETEVGDIEVHSVTHNNPFTGVQLSQGRIVSTNDSSKLIPAEKRLHFAHSVHSLGSN